MPIVESHLATVINPKADPEKLFAISVQIDSLLPGETYPELALPLFPPNFMKIPKAGQTVECITLAPELEDPAQGEPGEDGLGPEEFAEYIYWTGRIFDDRDRVPSELVQNYPKRTGWWTDDGTIIYMDDTSGSREIAIVMRGGSTFIRLSETKIQIQNGAQKIILETDRIHLDAPSRINLGGEPALEALLKGTFFSNPAQPGSLAKFLVDWTAAAVQLQSDLASLLAAPPVNPDTLTQKLKAYVDALVGYQGIVLGGITNWTSIKTFFDV